MTPSVVKGSVRLFLAAFFIAIGFGSSASYSAPLQFSPAEEAWLRQHPQVRIRVSPAYPPFEFLDDGQYRGMAYDYLMLVGQRLGIEFVPVPDLTWSQSLEQLRHRELDLILLITRTPEREQSMHFTHDYISFPLVIFSRKDEGFIGQLADLHGKTVAVEQGYITADWLRRDVANVRLKEFRSSAEAVEAVALNHADAYVGNLAVGTYLIEKKGLINLKVAAPASYDYDAMAMAVRKDWPELTTMIDRVLLNLSPDEHQAIRQKWLALRVEHGLRTIDIVRWVLIVGAVCLLWVAQLRWTVNRRTKELSREVQLRREKELALEQQSAQMNSIFDSLEAVVYVADLETLQLLYLNRHGRLLFGENWEGKSCFEFFHQSQTARCSFCTNSALIVSGVPQAPQVREYRNEKTGRWYQCIDRAIPWPDGRMVRLEIAIDITDRKEMDRIKDEMISVVSHEVRTPLTGMMGYAELMMNVDVSPEQRREFLGIIYHETERLAELFDNFLDLQTLKMEKAPPSHLSVNVETLLKESVDLFREASRKHRMQLVCSPDLPKVPGEVERLHRVFLNLISNAIKYSPDGGLVSISAYRSDDFVVVRVADEGIGIPPLAQERIFESFFRVDNSSNRRIGGTGLGLALVKETVNQHGGRVWVESQPGRGAAFFVSLPIIDS